MAAVRAPDATPPSPLQFIFISAFMLNRHSQSGTKLIKRFMTLALECSLKVSRLSVYVPAGTVSCFAEWMYTFYFFKLFDSSYLHAQQLLLRFTFLPLINQVMWGWGFDRVVVQLATKLSPTKNAFSLNRIFGGPVCLTVRNKSSNVYELIMSGAQGTHRWREGVPRLTLSWKLDYRSKPHNSSCPWHRSPDSPKSPRSGSTWKTIGDEKTDADELSAKGALRDQGFKVKLDSGTLFYELINL